MKQTVKKPAEAGFFKRGLRRFASSGKVRQDAYPKTIH